MKMHKHLEINMIKSIMIDLIEGLKYLKTKNIVH